MSPKPAKQKPGRKSTIASHEQRGEIELACSTGTSLRKIAETFAVSRSAIDRHWRGLSPEYRAALATIAEDLQRHQERLLHAFAAKRRTIQIASRSADAHAA